MKHSKHIARIVAFALLAVTMIGSFIGCKNAAGGDGSEDLTGFYVWKPDPNAEGEQVNYYAQFTKSTLQIYEVTESGGKVSLYEKRLGKRADSQDASSWNLQSIPYTAKGGVLTISATSIHLMYEDKPYTGSYDATGITIPGILIWPAREEPVTMTKTTDNFFNRIDPNPIFTPGVYVVDYSSSAVVLDFSETRTVQMYEIVKNETDGVVSWFPCFEPEGTFVAEKGKLTVTASTGEYEGQYSSTKVILPGKLTGTGDPSIDFVKGGDDFTKLERPDTITAGFYATRGSERDGNIVRSYAEITANNIQIYEVTENEAGDVIAWNPVLGTRTGTEPNYTWMEKAASYTASDEQGVFSFTASIGSWKEDKNYKIYGGKGGLATVNPYDSTENYTKAESFFDKLPSTIADGFYVTSGWENEDGGVWKDLAHFKDNTVQVYFLQEKTDGTISVSSPALGTAQDTKAYVSYTVEKGKIKFTGIYCRDDETRKDYYGFIGLDTVSLPGAFVGSGDSFREFTKTDKDYTDCLHTGQ